MLILAGMARASPDVLCTALLCTIWAGDSGQGRRGRSGGAAEPGGWSGGFQQAGSHDQVTDVRGAGILRNFRTSCFALLRNQHVREARKTHRWYLVDTSTGVELECHARLHQVGRRSATE